MSPPEEPLSPTAAEVAPRRPTLPQLHQPPPELPSSALSLSTPSRRWARSSSMIEHPWQGLPRRISATSLSVFSSLRLKRGASSSRRATRLVADLCFHFRVASIPDLVGPRTERLQALLPDERARTRRTSRRRDRDRRRGLPLERKTTSTLEPKSKRTLLPTLGAWRIRSRSRTTGSWFVSVYRSFRLASWSRVSTESNES